MARFGRSFPIPARQVYAESPLAGPVDTPVSDSATLTDNLTTLSTTNVVSDSGTLTDNVSRFSVSAVTDSATLTESASVGIIEFKTGTDSATLSDTASLTTITQVNVGVSDTFDLLESRTDAVESGTGPAGPPTLRAATGGQDSSSTANIISGSFPAGTTDGDLVLICVNVRNAGLTFAVGANRPGWTIVHTSQDNSGGAGAQPHCSAVFAKIYASGDLFPGAASTADSINWVTSGKYAFVTVAITPAAGSTITVATDLVTATPFIDTTNATTHNAPDLSVGSLTGISVLFLAARSQVSGATAITSTAPASWTEPSNGDWSTASGTQTGLRQVGASVAIDDAVTGTLTPGNFTTSASSSANLFHVFASGQSVGGAGADNDYLSVTDSATLTESADVQPVTAATPIVDTDSAALTDTFTALAQVSSVSDSASLSDSSALARSSSVTDSHTLTDIASGLYTSTVADSATLTESASTVQSIGFAGADSGTLSESATLAITATVTDSGTFTDASALQRASSVTDSATETETAALARISTVTDSVTLTDSALYVESAAFSVTDTATLSDTCVLQQSRQVTDAATLTDSAANTAQIGTVDALSLTETGSLGLPAVDAGTLTEVSSVARTSAVTDSATFTDALLGVGQASSVVDSATLADSSTFVRSSTLTDSATLSESAAIVTTLSVTDTATLGQSVLVDQGGLFSASDTVTLAETVSISVITVASDSATLADTGTIGQDVLKTGTDSGTLTESAALVRFSTVTDSATLTELGSVGASQTLSSSDSAILTESVSLVIVSTVTDTGTLSQSSTVDAGTFKIASDSATLSEFASISVTVSSADTAGLTESAIIGGSQNLTGNDSAIFSELATILVSYTVTDTFTLGNVAALQFQLTGTDGASLVDVLTALKADVRGNDSALLGEEYMPTDKTLKEGADRFTVSENVAISLREVYPLVPEYRLRPTVRFGYQE